MIKVDETSEPGLVEYRLETDANVVAFKHEDRNRPQGRIVGIDGKQGVGNPALWVMTHTGAVHGFGTAAVCTQPGGGSFPSGPTYVDFEVTASLGGYWTVTPAGQVDSRCATLADDVSPAPTTPVVAMAGARTGEGYALVTKAGAVYRFGSAPGWVPVVPALGAGDEAVDIEYSMSGDILWVLTKHGRVFAATSAGSTEVPGWSYDHGLHGDADSLIGDTAGFSVVSASGGVFSWNMPFMGSAIGQIGAGAVDAVPTFNALGFAGMYVASEKRVATAGGAVTGEWGQQGPWSVINPDAWGTWWEVLTGDGVRHFYGRGYDPYWFGATYSVRTVPFEQPDPFCDPRCDGAYQWDLDTSIDTRGRVMAWRWFQEVNWLPVSTGARWSYTRAANPRIVEYGGQSLDGEFRTPAAVTFLTLNRCAEATSPEQNTCPTWPDTPIDLLCGRVGACALTTNQPVFFSQLKLWRAETRISLSFFQNQAVNYFDFTYDWPDPGLEPGDPTPETSEPKMVLMSAKRRRLDTDETPSHHQMPVVSWGYVIAANRVHHPDGVSPMRMPRINGILNELGGRVEFEIGQKKPLDSPDCSMADFNATGFIRIPCDMFLVFDASACSTPGVPCPPNARAFVLFNKYKVTKTIASDDTDNELPAEQQARYETVYDYSDPAWAYSRQVGNHELWDPECDSTVIDRSRCNHWNDFRGHEYVAIVHPDGTGEQLKTFTGLLGEPFNGLGPTPTYSAPPVSDVDEGSHTNDRFKAGRRLEHNTRSATGALVDHSRTDYLVQQHDGVDGSDYWLALTDIERSRLYGNNGCREPDVAVDYVAYDEFGNPLTVDRFTDTPAVPTPACPNGPPTVTLRTTSEYAINNFPVPYLIHLPAFEEVTVRDTGQRQAATRWVYDETTVTAPIRGELTETRIQHDAALASDEGLWSTTRATYDSKGRVETWTDAASNPTRYTYDPVTGAIATITNAADHVQRFEVDQRFGGTTLVDDPATGITSAGYDGFGRLVWTNDAEGPPSGFPGLTEYEYALDPTRTITASMSATTYRTYDINEGHKQWTVSDGWGRVIQTQDADPNDPARQRLVSTDFDSFGRPHRQSRPYSWPGEPGHGWVPVPNDDWAQTISYSETAYNAKGEVESVTELGDGVPATTLTSRDGLTVTVTDPELRQTVRVHDPLGRLAAVAEPSPGGTTTYGYDPLDRLTSIVDPGGHHTTSAYRMDGNRISLTDPDMGLATAEFDSAGRLVTSTDAAGQTVWHKYDELNRVEEQRVGGPTGLRLATWLFDTERPGLLSESVANPDGAGHAVIVRYNYDDRGRTTSKWWFSSLSPGDPVEMLWTYGRDGSVATTTYPTGETLTHSYNTLGQQTSMVGWASYVSATTYNLDGLLSERRTSLDGAGGFDVELSYDPLHRWLIQTEAYGDNAHGIVAVNDVYDRDRVGNITDRVELNTGQLECFGYDSLNRLTAAYTTGIGASCTGHQPGVGPDPYAASWAYQADGNMNQALGEGTVNGAYTYGDVAHPHGVTEAGGVSLSYNPIGAVTSRVVAGQQPQTFSYDARHQLASVVQGAINTGFVYDADGMRFARTHDGTTTISYDDWVEDTVVDGFHTTRTIHYKANGEMIGNRAIPLSSGSPPPDQAPITWFAHDQIGSIIASRTGNSPPVRQRTYPYGTDRTINPNPQTDHNYIGKTLDPTGLYHLGARYYDPILGRFLAVDPLAAAENPQTVNPYAYSVGDPVTGSDPTGLCGWDAWNCVDDVVEGAAGAAADVGGGAVDVAGDTVGVVRDVTVAGATGAWDRGTTLAQYSWDTGWRRFSNPLTTLTDPTALEDIFAAGAILIDDAELKNDGPYCSSDAACLTGVDLLPTGAGTAGHTVLFEDDNPNDALVAHEMQHVYDIEGFGGAFFYGTYGVNFGVLLLGNGGDWEDAYENVWWEQRGRNVQRNYPLVKPGNFLERLKSFFQPWVRPLAPVTSASKPDSRPSAGSRGQDQAV